ncbi:aminotransferase class III-fold pyridoxal phosphate-dependent enzyme [Flavobacterium sp.]|jgi:taurine--2-oxoglutarate transaminase|uniref:aminotransferase class III-fold pyridoxal phosphate-dependent enzyme n=1 Tax=Flavobacterium sp. TaxID=239 RepID=UPI0022BEC9A7|nr:aminotransferase class III-fold pyridoxal phosphate-dependent enzyme [Flavobacterium sp.]MCZ8228686.1 aminotransferase class III-fold pyridoxal phosphate-dependent enzyme [Flavobacterium sp.]
MLTKEQIINDSKQYSLFSWSAQSNLNPLAIEKASGVYLYDYDGNKIIDFSSGLMSVNIGHGDQRITAAVVEQMQKVSFVTPSCTTEVRAKLAKKLASICPGNLNKAFFTLCGTSSVDNAIKLARLYTGRHKIIGRYRAFHGGSIGGMSVGGDPRKLANDGQQMPNTVLLDDPYYFFGMKELDEATKLQLSLEYVERIIHFEGKTNIAAFIFEGESGSSGCLHYPKGYLKGIKLLCEKYGILFIADEVMSGFGRTGKWFGFENHDIIPDMVCMAKGLTSSYLPLGCLMVSDTIAEKFDTTPMMIGLTYNAHPVALAAALAVINIYEEDKLIENTIKKGAYLEQKINELRAKHPSMGNFRNTGLLGCLDILKNKKTGELIAPYNASGEDLKVTNLMAGKLRALGLYTFVRWGYIFIAPPLCITEEEIDEGLAIISEALSIADTHLEV